jgi:hypothetical protein
MALDKSNLDPTGSGSKGVKCIGHYQTTDNRATVLGANYFNGAAEELARTRILWVFCSDKDFPCKVTITAGVVALAATDTTTS